MEIACTLHYMQNNCSAQQSLDEICCSKIMYPLEGDISLWMDFTERSTMFSGGQFTPARPPVSSTCSRIVCGKSYMIHLTLSDFFLFIAFIYFHFSNDFWGPTKMLLFLTPWLQATCIPTDLWLAGVKNWRLPLNSKRASRVIFIFLG